MLALNIVLVIVLVLALGWFFWSLNDLINFELEVHLAKIRDKAWDAEHLSS